MTLEYEAEKKRENSRRMTSVEKRVEKIKNLNNEEDIQELENWKTELQNMQDEKDSEEEIKSLAK